MKLVLDDCQKIQNNPEKAPAVRQAGEYLGFGFIMVRVLEVFPRFVKNACFKNDIIPGRSPSQKPFRSQCGKVRTTNLTDICSLIIKKYPQLCLRAKAYTYQKLNFLT